MAKPKTKQPSKLEMKPAETKLPAARPIVPAGDGFNSVDDSVGIGLVRGSKLKFSNAGEWIDVAGEVIEPSREFIITKLLRATQKWIEQRPVETIIIQDHEHFRDIERLNAEAPEEEMRVHYGQRKGPWTNSHFVYLLEVPNMDAFTWVTDTVGGNRAVSEFKDHVKRVRLLQGENHFPVVSLASTPMVTAYGTRDRPLLKVTRFATIRGQTPLIPPDEPEEPMNDEIKY
jgi:hypothetical protein